LKYKLVALDLDGTLLSDSKVIADSTKDLITEAQAKGVNFTIATGRMYRGAARYAKQLAIDIPIITYNGAVISDPLTGETHRELLVSATCAHRALDALKNEAVLKYIFTGDEVYTDISHKWTENYAKILQVEMKLLEDIKQVLDKDPIMLVFMVDANRRVTISDILRSELGSQARVTNSSDWFVDILHLQASKSRALEQLAKQLEIKREEIIAIGDNLNDLEMVEYAGLGVAVANASNELKDASDYITQKPFHFGVEEVIKKYCL
jgi:Cof subfamily protein (haloacid dehalogenase superfamily)